MFEQIKKNKDFYNKMLLNQRVNFEQAKRNNEQLNELTAKRDRLAALLEKITEYQNKITEILNSVMNEYLAYQNRRTAYLDKLITEHINSIFPDEGFEAHLSCDYVRNTKTTLELIDKDGHVHDPFMCEGKLLQYLVSFTAVSGIVQAMGSNELYIDEAFGAAAPDVKADIGDVIAKKVEEGMQIIMISQDPRLYKGIPHREFLIQKDPILATSKVVSVQDFEGEWVENE